MSPAFFDDTGARDGAWVILFLVVLCASIFGSNTLFRFCQVPVITGYMIIGFLFGPYVLRAMDKGQVQELHYITEAALSFIAMSAGAEIYLPEIKPLLRPIGWISLAMMLSMMILGTAFIYGVGAGTALLPWMRGYNFCNFGAAMLMAVIFSARSPTSVLAVVREMQAKGEVTSIVIGITVAGDVFVLTLFAVVSAMTAGFCSDSAFDAASFVVNLVMIPVAILWGVLLSPILMLLVRNDYLQHLILPLGFLTFLICDYILAISAQQTDFELRIDALLICITAGFVVGNTPQRDEMVRYLNSLTTYVFIPFFTVVGLQLDLPVMLNAMGFSVVGSIVRSLCTALGTYLGGVHVGMAQDKAALLWMGLIPQAGVSLGLAGIVGKTYESTWGSAFQSTMIGVILLNQAIGPLGAKYLINYTKEGGLAEDEDEGHGLKKSIGAFNDGYIQPKFRFSMETQTDDSLLDLVERGESAELEATSAKHIEHGRSTRGVGMEAVGGPLSPRRRLSRRYSARLMAPRNNKPVHGGYSALTLGDPVAAAADHAGDVEMQARGEGLYAEPAVENPLWEVGGGGAREGQGQGQGQKEGVGEESSALGSPVPALLRFFRGGSVK